MHQVQHGEAAITPNRKKECLPLSFAMFSTCCRSTKSTDWKRRAESKRNAGHYMLKRPTHSSQGGLSGQSGQRLLRVAHSGKAFLYGRDGRVHQLQLCGATSRNEFSWIARSGKSDFSIRGAPSGHDSSSEFRANRSSDLGFRGHALTSG